MPHHDGRPRDERRIPAADREDFGQADYSTDYGYDPHRRTGYRTRPDFGPREDYREAAYSTGYSYEPEDRRIEPPSRSWMNRAGEFFAGGPREDRPPRRRGPSDRVLWAVIVERLEDERRLDLSDVEVIVEDCEVTLNGTIRRKEDKRRIEDVADIDGIRHVQNNLRVRGRDHWTFL